MRNIKLSILKSISTMYFLIIYAVTSFAYINFFPSAQRPDMLKSYYYNLLYYFLFALIILILAIVFKNKYTIILNTITLVIIVGDFVVNVISAMSG